MMIYKKNLVHLLAVASSVAVYGQESPCNEAKSESACESSTDDATGDACVWCESRAIASICVTEDQSKSLPPAVFRCDSHGNNDNGNDNVNDNSFIHTYQFQTSDAANNNNDNVSYHLNIKEHTPDDESSDICDSSSKSVSGYMDVKGSKYDAEGENKHLFFWMFEKRGTEYNENVDDDDETPFMIWLTGGPGCSSTLALLSENGPCSVNPEGTGTVLNPYSWTESAHVLWLDQPAGVGFSYGDENDSNEEMISEDAYYFVQAFMDAYPQYLNNPLFIVGESYGGHYAPAIAHRIFIGNQQLKNNNNSNLKKLNLAGLGIGNGLTAPQEQYKWYPDMVYNNSHHLKVVPEPVYEAMKAVVPKCVTLIEKCQAGNGFIDKFACQAAFVTCNMGLTSPYQLTGLNPYDIRIKCEVPPLCYDFSNVQKWLNLPSTQAALNVDTSHPHRWESCNFGINMKFHTDWMQDFSHYVADLLNADDEDIRVLIYAGDVDFICNYLGNKAWTSQLDWNHKDEFNAAGEHDWKGNGLARTFGDFTFLQVYDAGHMVPSDQPEVALDMITDFLLGKPF